MIGDKSFEKYGQALTAACANTYSSSPSGIGPESFVFIGERNNTNGITINNPAFYKQHGFDFEVTQYILRPEVMESVFYAYRTTGDAKWQEIAWNAWTSIYKHCLVQRNGALAALANVNATRPTQLDDSESFLYAETFKYLYLIFADPAVLDLDRYVLNTEAHPFEVDSRRRRAIAQRGRRWERRRRERRRAGRGMACRCLRFRVCQGWRRCGWEYVGECDGVVDGELGWVGQAQRGQEEVEPG